MEKIGAFAEKWGSVSVAAAGLIYYLQEKIIGLARCNRIHVAVDKRINEKCDDLAKDFKKEVQRLLDKFDSFKDKMIDSSAKNTERIDGIAARMTHHYQDNMKQNLEILEEIRGLKK